VVPRAAAVEAIETTFAEASSALDLARLPDDSPGRARALRSRRTPALLGSGWESHDPLIAAVTPALAIAGRSYSRGFRWRRLHGNSVGTCRRSCS